MKPTKITIYHNTVSVGGIAAYIKNLCCAIAQIAPNLRTDILLIKKGEKDFEAMPVSTTIVDFDAFSHNAMPIVRVARHLLVKRPDILLCTGFFRNIVGVLVVRFLRLFGLHTKIVITEHSDIRVPHYLHRPAFIRYFLNHFLHIGYRLTYPFADAIVAVSRGAGEGLEQTIGLPKNLVRTIYNPVITPDFYDTCNEDIKHHWLSDAAVKTILGVGRLNQQKDFINLLNAFALVHNKLPNTRLLILGEGAERPALEKLISDLNLSKVVSLYGAVPNALPYMKQSSLFVLSSRFEGLPTVLIEALGAGCPVVSTDCPSGPMEILEGGRYGTLVPTENSPLLAAAIEEALCGHAPATKEERIVRANGFSSDHCAKAYFKLFCELL